MKHASEDMLHALTERGYRITEARRGLCAALTAAKDPLTIQELAERTASDEASAYRFIALLRKERLVEEIVVRGERPRYAPADHHHHHVVCTDCGVVAHVPCGDAPHAPRTVPGFATIEDHDVTFYGRCVSCK